MLKDILTLMLAIVLSFTTGGSVQDEKMNDSVFQMETIHSFDGRLRVEIDATEMMIRLDITDEERGELLYSFSPARIRSVLPSQAALYSKECTPDASFSFSFSTSVSKKEST